MEKPKPRRLHVDLDPDDFKILENMRGKQKWAPFLLGFPDRFRFFIEQIQLYKDKVEFLEEQLEQAKERIKSLQEKLKDA